MSRINGARLVKILPYTRPTINDQEGLVPDVIVEWVPQHSGETRGQEKGMNSPRHTTDDATLGNIKGRIDPVPVIDPNGRQMRLHGQGEGISREHGDNCG